MYGKSKFEKQIFSKICTKGNNGDMLMLYNNLTLHSTFMTNAQVSVTVERKYGDSGRVRIGFTTSPGSASSTVDGNQDFRAQSDYLVFTHGQSEKTISIGLVNDRRPEGPETFFMNLTSIELQEPL